MKKLISAILFALFLSGFNSSVFAAENTAAQQSEQKKPAAEEEPECD